ncbi:hypothetical protein E2562_034872 [Oryza meyeriana var. granulata]|uniref:Uncharacterized protein n=1 Tax=Oryza meyeriana var. granulata TaxID=110450 RepID=A0A6G1C0H5_9ORYZ|nr:hypothetical protein E2562_034872 [Oryza meyeriana var. granulata]
MPLDLDSSPAPPHRDWFFPPAPPFLPSSRARTPRTFFPSTSRSSNPYSFSDRRPPPTPRSRSRSPLPPPEQQQQQPPPTPPPAPRRRDPRYAGIRRGDARTLAAEKAAAAAPTVALVHGSKSASSATTLPWSGMVSVAVRNGPLCSASLPFSAVTSRYMIRSTI